MELLTRAEMMRLLGCKDTALWKKELAGLIPPAIRRPGMHPRWIRAEVEEALQRHLAGCSPDQRQRPSGKRGRPRKNPLPTTNAAPTAGGAQ